MVKYNELRLKDKLKFLPNSKSINIPIEGILVKEDANSISVRVEDKVYTIRRSSLVLSKVNKKTREWEFE